jgi:hypothetical protein
MNGCACYDSILAFAAAVRAEAKLAEKEACAKVADPKTVHSGISNKTREAIAAAIRARSS